eukprot:314388-Rhodomonas_salina.4
MSGTDIRCTNYRAMRAVCDDQYSQMRCLLSFGMRCPVLTHAVPTLSLCDVRYCDLPGEKQLAADAAARHLRRELLFEAAEHFLVAGPSAVHDGATPLPPYDPAMPCQVLTHYMVLSAYAPALPCPVLTWRMPAMPVHSADIA